MTHVHLPEDGMSDIATMKLLGGRPCLDLVNTVDVRLDSWGPDLLERYDDLLDWCARTDVLTQAELMAARSAASADPHAAAQALAEIKALREAIASVLGALADGQDVPSADATVLADAAARARHHQHLVVAGSHPAWIWRDEDPLERIGHRIALDAAVIVTTDALRERVRVCHGPKCGWLFLDTTRNRSRRWCSEATCGTRTRVQRFRARDEHVCD